MGAQSVYSVSIGDAIKSVKITYKLLRWSIKQLGCSVNGSKVTEHSKFIITYRKNAENIFKLHRDNSLLPKIVNFDILTLKISILCM